MVAGGPIDAVSLIAALGGGGTYLALALLSLAVSRPDGIVSPVWLPNAFALAFLLRARIANEWAFLGAAAAASFAANLAAMQPAHVALTFSLAHVIEIVTVLALMRRASGSAMPDMTRLSDLAAFVWAAGMVGPLASALCAAPVFGTSIDEVRAGMIAWFLTGSVAMVLIVPTVMLLAARAGGQGHRAPAGLSESVALMAGGMTCAFLVFNQNHYPLMFLIQPITLLHAFRLGSLGSALHVAGVALVAGAMTWSGHGPIAASGLGAITTLHLLQAFLAANFLTGLPVAAILAGRDRMMAELGAGKRRLDLLAGHITDAVLRYDLDGVCTYASPSVREVMGQVPETYLGRHAAARLHPDARDRTLDALARLLCGASDKERVTYRRFADDADGAPVFLEADCAIIRNPETGAREGVVVSARDVTERVELELLLTRARRQAEHSARAKSEFLANMSHEIRTPMNGVLGFAELMLQGDLAPDQRRYAELIVQSGRSMMMLLNDVLDLSKIESGQFTIARAPINLHDTLAECSALHRLAAEAKGLDLHLCAAEGKSAGAGVGVDATEAHREPPWIVTDGLRLRQIMLNLIGNAIKFTEVGSIRVDYRIGTDAVRIQIADSGIGISPARLDAIFDPFTQGEGDAARRFGGTGLGLSISRQLAALLGGRIEVASTPGEGSCFTLVLPAALAPPGPASPPLAATVCATQAPEVTEVPLPLASRILLAEDHDINRMLMCEMLERCGQEVALAHDGNEAIAMVIDSIIRARPYDLVLMDVQMPGCDGYAATRAIRAEGIGPGMLPIIALTANAFPEDIAAARAAGMQAHLAKPLVFADLAWALQRWLPTRIVETAAPAVRPARASAMALSPQLVSRWQQRRGEAVEAVRRALAAGVLAQRGRGRSVNPALTRLAQVVHKLAGSAAMFGEVALGESAAALEAALRPGKAGEGREALARALLALADAGPGGAADGAQSPAARPPADAPG
jgi:PAS domain S-box-containing protein